MTGEADKRLKFVRPGETKFVLVLVTPPVNIKKAAIIEIKRKR